MIFTDFSLTFPYLEMDFPDQKTSNIVLQKQHLDSPVDEVYTHFIVVILSECRYPRKIATKNKTLTFS